MAMFSLLGSCNAALALYGLMALLHGAWKQAMSFGEKKPKPKMKEPCKWAVGGGSVFLSGSWFGSD